MIGGKADVVQHAFRLQMLHPKSFFAADSLLLWIQIFQGPSHHGFDQLIIIHIFNIFRNDMLSVTHNCHSVAQFKQLFQFM